MRRALLLACALGAASRLDAQVVTARVGSELTAANYYSPVTVPITVDMSASGGATLGSYTARLTWSPSALYYNGYVSGGSQDSTAQGNFPPPAMNSDSASQGILKFTAVSPAGVAGLVTIAQLRFYAGTDTVPSPVTLSFSEMSAAGTFTNLLPFLTVQGATYCRSRGLWGDLDGDQQANSRDALIVLSSVVGLPVNPLVADTARADVDEDGRTTSRDALIILSFAVGMPIQGQRVLLPVASACGTGSAQQLAIQPGAIDLAVGQPMRLLAQATDSAGRSVTLPPMTWRSSDYAVAGVDNTGLVTPRAAGTATITAEAGPGVTATATVQVLARRPNWYVDVAATGRAVQNGSPTYPFETPLQAFPLVSEGDTIRVAPGTYDWADDGHLSHGVVVQGGTPGDTTTRPVFRGPDNFIAFWLQGGQRYEFRNVVIQSFIEGFELDALRELVLEDVKLVSGQNAMDGIYLCANATVDSIRIDRTEFLGGPQTPYPGDAVYVGGCVGPDVRVMVFRDSRIERFNDALYLYSVDSLQVLRSVIRDNTGDGLYLSPEYNEVPALHVAHSRIERNRYGQVYVSSARRIVIDSSVIRTDSSNALQLYHDNTVRGHTYLRGDSVYQDPGAGYYGYDWLGTNNTDSLAVEDLVLRFADDTASAGYSSIQADRAVVRRSRFINPGSGAVFDFTGRLLVADSVTMTGCAVAGCDGATGFHFNASGTQPLARVLRSSFTGMYSGINAYGGATTAAVLEARGLTLDSIYDGIYAYQMDSVDVAANTITRAVYSPIQVWLGSAARPSRVAGNNVTCTPASLNTPSGVLVANSWAVVEQDTVTACFRGIETNTVSPGTRVRQNTLRGNAYGVTLWQFNATPVPVDSNGVSGSDSAAVYVYYASASLTHNRIENNPGNGLFVFSSQGFVTPAHDNAFVNNLGWDILVSGDSVDATGNWWDPPGMGASPDSTLPNGVSGRIDTGSPLPSAPANLPGLAPPSLLRAASPATVPAGPVAAPAQAVRESADVRLERDRQARLAAKAAKDARHAAHVRR